jgi:hypothetical protein
VSIFLSLPIWAFTILVSLAFNLFAAVGLTLFLRAWPAEPRVPHNDIAGYISAIVGIVYGVLIASIAVVVLQNADAARVAVDTEAGLVINVFGDAKALPEPTSAAIRADVLAYVRAVIDTEWPDMRQNNAPTAGLKPIFDLRRNVAAFVARDARDETYLAAMLRNVDGLVMARRNRLNLAHHYVSPMIWRFLISSSVLTLLITFVFGVRKFWPHLIMCCLLATTMGFVFSLIIVVDDPFLWQTGIGPEPFEEAVAVMRQMDATGVWGVGGSR